MSKLKQAAFWVILVAIVGAPIVVAELVLRRAGLGDPILFHANMSYRYAPQPNQSRVRRGGAKVTIDSKGFRAVRDWTSPADGKLLFVGDSVTWGGTYIDDADTFAAGVCARLEKATAKRLVCGNASANQYGTDNMAERIRYKEVDDESALIITLISDDTLRGLRDAEGPLLFTAPPPGPFKALWEATAFLVWELNRAMRPIRPLRSNQDFQVAERRLHTLFAAINETQRPGRKVLIVLSPTQSELNGNETALTKAVRTVLARSGFDFLDLHGAVSAAHTPGFYYDGVHLDRSGHHFYADQIAQRLLAHVSGPERR
jgi:lysophospholipase L1-like esterase